jgi:endonuclease/exonuclease/phosphatase family metal-dependent hydrolase
MHIKTLTWNIGGGKLLREGSDPDLLASYNEDGLDAIIGLLESEKPDIITLQEIQVNSTKDQAKEIADRLGYTYVRDIISDSHIDTDCELGHAILTRYEIISHSYGFFTNPNVEIEWEDGSTASSFDKGYSTCVLKIDNREVAVTTLHLVPFRRFDIDIHSDMAKSILKNVQDTINDDHSPWLIQGDFNINDSQLESYLPRLFNENTTEIALEQPTTPKDRKYDHIILRGGKLLNHKVISDVLTDHYPVVAEVEI